MPRKSKISVVILTLNEEKNIRDCLESVKWADEIIIIDSESTDKTVEIAKKYTDKIYTHKFEDDFAKQRNFSISKAEGEWMLFLDADETHSSGSEKIIRKCIEKKDVEGFWFPRRNYIDDKTYLKYGLFYPDWQLRLLRNTKELHFRGSIHEQAVIPEEKTQKIKELEIYHNPSRTKYDSFLSFHRMIPFIAREGNMIKTSKIPNGELIKLSLITLPLEIWWNIVKRRGYKDGWPGIRGILIWALYKELAVLSAIKLRLY